MLIVKNTKNPLLRNLHFRTLNLQIMSPPFTPKCKYSRLKENKSYHTKNKFHKHGQKAEKFTKSCKRMTVILKIYA